MSQIPLITKHSNFFFNHSDTKICSLDEGPLAGLRHRTVIDQASGAASTALWQEEHLPGFHVPLHLHDCEEIITVIDGEIEASIGAEKFPVGPLQSFLIPAWALHGFRVTSNVPVKLLAIFSSANPKIFREDGIESIPPWEGGESDHLERAGDQ